MSKKIFCLALGAMLLAISCSDEARQAKKVPQVGILCPLSKPCPRYVAVQQGLRELGYVEGKSIMIEGRFAGENPERLPELAADLARLKVDVIVPFGLAGLRGAQQATRTIPIVMPGGDYDPVEQGFVASLSRPGGNITGLAELQQYLVGKRLELLKEIFPKISRVAILWSARFRGPFLRETEGAARSLGLKLYLQEVRGPEDFESAFSAIVKERVGAVLVPGSPLVAAHGTRIVELLTRNRLPAIFSGEEYMEAGGLMSYAPNRLDQFRRAAYFVDKILKGTKPADLPVEQPTKFDLVINLKTAKQIGLTIPPEVLVRADRVIK